MIEVSLAFAGKAVAGKALSASIDEIVRTLLQVQNRQLILLQSVHQNVQVMMEGPWNRAQTQLELALTVQGPEQRLAMDKAAAALEEAVSLFQGSGKEPAVAADLSIVHGALGNRPLAEFWARRSFNAAESFLDATARKAQRGIRTPPPRRESMKRRLFSPTPPSIEWLWWKNEVSEESQLTSLARHAGVQAAFVPLRLRLRPALELGTEIPSDDPKEQARILAMPGLNWLQAKTVAWTMALPEIESLYDAHRMNRQLQDYAGLCKALGGDAKAGRLHVDLSAQEIAVIEYARHRNASMESTI